MRQRGTIIKRGSTWTAIYADPKVRDERGRKKPRWRAFKTEEAAEAYLDVQLGAIRTNTHVAPSQKTWAQLFDGFETDYIDHAVAGNHMSPSTAAAYKSIVTKHLRPFFGEARVMDMTTKLMRAWAVQLQTHLIDGEPIANKTVTNIINVMSKACRWAKVAEFDTRNWVEDADLKRPKRPKLTMEEEDQMFLSEEEVEVVLDFTRTPGGNTAAKVVIALGLMAGLRRGEMAALQWGSILWESRQLRIMQAISAGEIRTETKSTASRATIDVPATFLRILQEHKDAETAAGRSTARAAYVLQRGPRDKRRQAMALKQGKMASTLPEGVYHPDEVDQLWDEQIRVPLKLAPEKGLHAMRHTYASYLIVKLRENHKYVQKQMRHANIQITLDTYTHLFQDTNPKAMADLDRFLGPKVVDFRSGTHGA